MGLSDRGYMRERRTTTSLRKTRWGSAPWIKVAIMVVALGMIFKLASYSLNERDVLPFPPTGEVQWFIPTPEQNTAALSISAPLERKINHVVRLDDWGSNAPIALIPIRGGETASIQIPLGRYRVIMASGTTWQGSAKLFGVAGSVRKAVDPLEFYRVNNQTVGHTIDLSNRLNGNMETRPVGYF